MKRAASQSHPQPTTAKPTDSLSATKADSQSVPNAVAHHRAATKGRAATPTPATRPASTKPNAKPAPTSNATHLTKPATASKPSRNATHLTDMQAQFVREYLVDLNATQAALRAGYSEKNAESIGCRLIKISQVKAAIDQALAKRAQRTEISADRVLKELALLGFANMADYIKPQPDGTAYVDLSGLTREQAAAIQEITVDEYTEGRGEDARQVKKVRLKLADKRGSLELLGKHLGMFRERVELTGKDGGPVAHEIGASLTLEEALQTYRENLTGGGKR